MTETEKDTINVLHQRLSALTAPEAKFVNDLKALKDCKPNLRLSEKQGNWLSRIYHRLLREGVI